MFGLGAGEILIILVFALIFIGPKKLPELAKSLGKGLREFQKAKDELMNHVEEGKNSLLDSSGINDVKKNFNDALSEESDHSLTEEEEALTGVNDSEESASLDHVVHTETEEKSEEERLNEKYPDPADTIAQGQSSSEKKSS